MNDGGINETSPLARAERGLDILHPSAIVDPEAITALLQRLCREAITLNRGMNRHIEKELAWVDSVSPAGCTLRTHNFEHKATDAIFLNFVLDGQQYFLSAPFDRELARDRFLVRPPSAVYRAERRGRSRTVESGATRVLVEIQGLTSLNGVLVNASAEGLAIELAERDARGLEQPLRIHFVEGSNAGRIAHGEVKHKRPALREGWIRLGLELSSTPRGAPVEIERRGQIIPTTRLERAHRGWRLLGAAARFSTDRILGLLGRATAVPTVQVVDYANSRGENIRALVDCWGDTRGATAVVIPPAWGRTKETLLPLALAIVAAFRAAKQPVVVIRFDGIRKRGESFRDPACDVVGKEHHRFSLSQSVSDIRATLDFLDANPALRPKQTILVSFSAASIEARRAVATDSRVHGWISVVGASDMQSAMRVISGGVDYVAGAERGVRFGLQEVLGVEVDIDYASADMLKHRLGFLEDSRRDFSQIQVPITWISGEHDAWMDADRALDVMSRGDTSARRFIKVPTGHTLRTSTEALETFQLIASEVSRMALGRALPPVLPDLHVLEAKRRAERNRLKTRRPADLRSFWRTYLLGADGRVGIELMARTSPYRSLMSVQAAQLALTAETIVVDLGSGTGAFSEFLARTSVSSKVVAIDLIPEAHLRSRQRLRRSSSPLYSTRHVVADLDASGMRIPLADRSVNAVLASLILSYLKDPVSVLREVHRVLKVGGRVAVSSLRRDADLSKLFAVGLKELQESNELDGLGLSRMDLDVVARAHLNSAARLMDLEESGRFSFWDTDELEAMLRIAGFHDIHSVRSLGDPPQAIVTSGARPQK